MGSPYPNAMRLDAVEYYQEGNSPKAVVALLAEDGWEAVPTGETVKNWCKAAGVAMHPPTRPHHPARDKGLSMLIAGKSIKYVSDVLDVDYRTVNNWMRTARATPGNKALPVATTLQRKHPLRDLALDLMRGGWPPGRIKRELKVSHSTAYDWARQVQAEQGPHGEA